MEDLWPYHQVQAKPAFPLSASVYRFRSHDDWLDEHLEVMQLIHDTVRVRSSGRKSRRVMIFGDLQMTSVTIEAELEFVGRDGACLWQKTELTENNHVTNARISPRRVHQCRTRGPVISRTFELRTTIKSSMHSSWLMGAFFWRENSILFKSFSQFQT